MSRLDSGNRRSVGAFDRSAHLLLFQGRLLRSGGACAFDPCDSSNNCTGLRWPELTKEYMNGPCASGEDPRD